jgi:hypothetical protein
LENQTFPRPPVEVPVCRHSHPKANDSRILAVSWEVLVFLLLYFPHFYGPWTSKDLAYTADSTFWVLLYERKNETVDDTIEAGVTVL